MADLAPAVDLAKFRTCSLGAITNLPVRCRRTAPADDLARFLSVIPYRDYRDSVIGDRARPSG
jgi:hypothetical protein